MNTSMPPNAHSRLRPAHWRKAAPALLGLLLVWSCPAESGVFNVSPVRMYMGPRDRTIAVTVTNGSDSEAVIQAEAFEWSQTPEGQDQLKPSDDLVLAPPIIKLPPRGRQVVRLAMVAPRDASRQLTYRIIMREVPEALPRPASGVQMQVALAMNMPVFVTPAAARRKLECQLHREAATLQAACLNAGTAYAQVRELRLHRHSQVLARFEGGQYILPGATHLIGLKADSQPAPGPATVTVRFDDGTETASELVLP
jgi:fimbrial chaperone protein